MSHAADPSLPWDGLSSTNGSPFACGEGRQDQPTWAVSKHTGFVAIRWFDIDHREREGSMPRRLKGGRCVSWSHLMRKPSLLP